MISEDIPLLETIVNEVTQESPDIISISIENSSEDELINWNRKEEVDVIHLMTFERDILMDGDVLFGKMKVVMNAGPMHEQIREHVSRVRWIFVGILSVFAVFLIVGLHRVIIRPVNSINVRLRDLAGGDLEGRLSLRAARELVALANSVNALGDSWKLQHKREKQLQEAQAMLEESHERLENYNKNLESQG